MIPGTAGERRWVEIPKNACMQRPASRGMILQAAGAVQPGAAIVLGAGRCEEIPLRELVERFDRLTLVDHDEQAMNAALESLGDSQGSISKIGRVVADLTGAIGGFLEAVSETLRSSTDAIEELSKLADATRPIVFSTGLQYDLIIVSCVSCQLHVSACNQAIALFEAAFPDRSEELRRSSRWIEAMQGLAR